MKFLNSKMEIWFVRFMLTLAFTEQAWSLPLGKSCLLFYINPICKLYLFIYFFLVVLKVHLPRFNIKNSKVCLRYLSTNTSHILTSSSFVSCSFLFLYYFLREANKKICEKFCNVVIKLIGLFILLL